MSQNIKGVVLFLAAVLAAPTIHAAVSAEPTPTVGVVVKIGSGGAPTAQIGYGIEVEPDGLAARSDYGIVVEPDGLAAQIGCGIEVDPHGISTNTGTAVEP